MMPYARQGKLVAQPGQRNALAAIMLDERTGLASMPGCRLYLILADEREPDALLVTELWDSADAHQASLGLPGVAETIAKARPLIDRVEGEARIFIGGTGFE